MENVHLIGQVTGGGFDDYFGRRLAVAPPPPPRRSIQGSFTFAAPSPPPFQYTTYEAASLYSSLSLPLHLPYTYYAAAASAPATATPLLPRMLPPLPPSATVVRRRIKKPRTPRSGEGQARAPQRRRPLERAAPLPPPAAVAEALDDLEREVTRGFVEDLLHALAPPPSSLPLPTFSLVRAAAAKAAASCAV
ncbi:hypothetical protein EE612_049988 [Oryza sativa]|jgi:hypothetical protein|uniref:Uncharacterized protein n=2 Tax=Oryza TaxID=4527 RepID=A0A0E0IPE2_ORYNI|nr:hypothetical protein OsI_32717 [Oryza sativa Indica Group]KAB8112039.1 hypothetical protein EE612_049988 [Oryza sativa]